MVEPKAKALADKDLIERLRDRIAALERQLDRLTNERIIALERQVAGLKSRVLVLCAVLSAMVAYGPKILELLG